MARPQTNGHNRRLFAINPLKTRAESVSETLITMSFPSVLTILLLGKSISQLQLNTKAYNPIRAIVMSCVILAACSSMLGVMAWLCVSNILNKGQSKKLYNASKQLIYFSCVFLMLLTSMLFLLLELASTISIVLMFVITIVILLTLFKLIWYSNKNNDHDIATLENVHNATGTNSVDDAASSNQETEINTDNEVNNPESEITIDNGVDETIIIVENVAPESSATPEPDQARNQQAFLDVTNGVAILFFSGMAGKIFEHFSEETNNNYTMWTMWSLYIGSLLSAGTMLAHFVIPGIYPTKVNWLKYLNYGLVFWVTVAAMASTYKMAKVNILLELLPLIIAYSVGLGTMFIDRLSKDGDNDFLAFLARLLSHWFFNDELRAGGGDEHKPISISFTNLAFTGLLAALGYTGKHVQNFVHKAFAFLMSSALVSSLIWRVLTHEPPSTRAFLAAKKTLAFLTLLLVTFSVIAFMVLAIQSL